MISEVDNDIGVFSVKRTAEGTKIYAKSPVFEEFFRGMAKGNHISCAPRWKGVEIYQIPEEALIEHFILDHCHINSPGEHLILNGMANLTFLRHVGLSEGVSFMVGTMPCKRTYLEDFCDKMKAGIRELYLNYIRPFDNDLLVMKESSRR